MAGISGVSEASGFGDGFATSGVTGAAGVAGVVSGANGELAGIAVGFAAGVGVAKRLLKSPPEAGVFAGAEFLKRLSNIIYELVCVGAVHPLLLEDAVLVPLDEVDLVEPKP